eukprot:scaffold30495_cov142-Skeletonema_dohrnii-CCMP3373.AAC.1
MMLLKTVILLSWAANECTAFVPSILVPRRDLFQPHLSNNNEVSTKNEVKVKHCIPLQEIGLDDLPRVGGKTASLGEMIQNLAPLGVSDIDVNDLENLADRGRKYALNGSLATRFTISIPECQARLMIMNAGLPDEVIHQIEESYQG